MGLEDEKYVSVTAFRRSGAAVTTPTWVVPLERGRFGFWTSSATGKAKRLRTNPKVTVQPCDVRGRVKPGTAALGATAELVSSGPDFDAIQTRVKAKYGIMVPISNLFNTLGRRPRCRAHARAVSRRCGIEGREVGLPLLYGGRAPGRPGHPPAVAPDLGPAGPAR